MKKAYPALNDKNLNAFTDGHKSDYARPLQLFPAPPGLGQDLRRDDPGGADPRERLADAFRDARQINAINAG